MSDYKLIRFEPTPEMNKAAEEAYMPFGDMDLALRMAILAAPAVQVEPVAFCEDAALSIAERTFSMEVDEQLASDIIQYAGRLHSLYTAQHPAKDGHQHRRKEIDLHTQTTAPRHIGCASRATNQRVARKTIPRIRKPRGELHLRRIYGQAHQRRQKYQQLKTGA